MTILRFVQRRRGRTRGQSLVEFALVLPVFLLMLLGLIDVSRFVFLNSTLSQAAREGARLGSVEASYKGSADPACGTFGGPVCPTNDGALLADITVAANRMMAPFGSVASTQLNCVARGASPPSWIGNIDACTSNGAGGTISIRVTATFTPLTPVIGQLIGTKTLSGSTSMTIN